MIGAMSRAASMSEVSASPILQAFFAAGYSKRQALDVVMGMAFSVMANYASHLTRPPLDSFLATHVWTR